MLSVVSYNIHRCIGWDRRRDPSRIARILNELKADIVGLQEVHSVDGSPESHQMRYLADATGLHAIPGPALFKANTEYGNVLLTRHRVVDTRKLDLSVPGHEPRGAIDATLEINNNLVQVIVSHFGLSASERRYQAKRLLSALRTDDSVPIIVIMDHNEWFPTRQCLRMLHNRLGRPPRVCTFPSFLPFLPHDRVWVRPRKALIYTDRYVTPLTRLASDHLPLKALIDTEKLSS